MDYEALKKIPKMDTLLARPAVTAAAQGLPRTLVRESIQAVLGALRQSLLDGTPLPDEDALDAALVQAISAAGQTNLRRLINATGVVLHTNLGRAPLGDAIASHVARVAAGYSNLELDLDSGKRGMRYAHVEALLCRLTGAQAALVVNNNASAVFLMLNTLAKGKKVAISRGELVDIGVAFRVPEIMEQSVASLMEIGTTFKTHLRDYENALLAPEIGAILKVHHSNFKMSGFTTQAQLAELAPLAQAHDVPLLYDLGAGFLLAPEALGLHEGIDVRAAVKQAHVVCFSGDKLLGSAQAGILLGRREYIDRMKKNQLTRMLRVDKLTLAALEATLRWYLDSEGAAAHIPVLDMLRTTERALFARADALARQLHDICPHCHFEAVRCTDEPGGGSLPECKMPGWAVSVQCPDCNANTLQEKLRGAETPIIARIAQDRLLLSVRTLMPGDEADILAAFAALKADA